MPLPPISIFLIRLNGTVTLAQGLPATAATVSDTTLVNATSTTRVDTAALARTGTAARATPAPRTDKSIVTI